MKYDKMVKKLRKFMIILMMVSILGYGVKRHTDTVADLAGSVWKMIKEPFATAQNIQDSKVLLGFPSDCLEIATSFQEKLPEEKEFFMSDVYYRNALVSQRMIEFNFPKLYTKTAKCGFISSDEIITAEQFKTIDVRGGYKIVCHL